MRTGSLGTCCCQYWSLLWVGRIGVFLVDFGEFVGDSTVIAVAAVRARVVGKVGRRLG